MAIQITDDGATIKFVDDVNDKVVNFNKRGGSIRRKGTDLEIIDNEYSEEFAYSDVTVPSLGTADLLRAAIEVMLENPAGVTGRNITPNAPDTKSVTNVDSIIVPANPNRIWVSFTNLGTKNIFLAMDTPAILNSGIGLVQNLGEIEFRAEDIGVGDIHAITTGGVAATVAILETETTT